MLRLVLLTSIFILLPLCYGSCMYSFSSSWGNAETAKHKRDMATVTAAAADTGFCINIAYKYRGSNNVVTTNHLIDDESDAIRYIALTTNKTIISKINIDCKNKPTISNVGDNLVAYSYNCCPDSANLNEVYCDYPVTPSLKNDHNGGNSGNSNMMTSLLITTEAKRKS